MRPLDRWVYTWPLRLRSLFRRGQVEQELDEARGPLADLIDRRLRVQLPVEYYGDRYADAANSQKLPSYTVLNASVRFDVTKQLTLQGCRVTCVEKDKTMAEMAKRFCDQMIVGDIESDKIGRQFSTERFDVVTFGEVLEHLRDPVGVLVKVKHLIAPTGYLVASIQNVAHRSLRLSLLFGEFDYGDIGLLDRTHLRFFTIRTIEKMMNESGFKIVDMVRIRDASLMDSLLRRTASWSQRALLEIVKVLFRGLIRGEALTYQFVIKAVPM